MTLLITHKSCPAIRGYLKRWFIEVKPNVYVSTVNGRIFDNVLQFLYSQSKEEFSFMYISKNSYTQGLNIHIEDNFPSDSINISGYNLPIKNV